MEKTAENLKGAFAGESQANRRYLFFAQKAEEEGFSQVGKLFRAAAEAETVHAFNHIRIMGETKSTPENLQAAIAGETFEYKHMYPDYTKTAKKEKNTQALWSFTVANQVEHVHANLFTKAMKALKTRLRTKSLRNAPYAGHRKKKSSESHDNTKNAGQMTFVKGH
jgi:rubrerythrin